MTRRTADGTLVLTGVGNGGLALRRVESCLRVTTLARRQLPRLRTLRGSAPPSAGGSSRTCRGRCALSQRRGAGRARRRRSSTGALASTFVAEDKFWSEMAPRLDPTFRIPPPETALSFAFETSPRECFELNGRRLPFGCHKWWHHDREFWEPYLIGTAAAARSSST